MGNRAKIYILWRLLSFSLFPLKINREKNQDWIENFEGNISDNEFQPFIPFLIELIPIFVHVIPSFWSILTTSFLQLTSMNTL